MLDVARDLRENLAGALERRRMFLISTVGRAAVRLLVDPEPEAAALVAYAFRQQRNIPIAAKVLTRLRAAPTFDEAAIVARATELSPEETVRIALDALDRVIAAEIAALPERTT